MTVISIGLELINKSRARNPSSSSILTNVPLLQHGGSKTACSMDTGKKARAKKSYASAFLFKAALARKQYISGMSSSSPQDKSDFTLAQQVAITLVPAFMGTLSILGSSCIIVMLLAKDRKKLKSVKYRFLFALCCSDIFNSLVFLPYSLPIPKGTPGVWGAMGNKASCDAQGAFIQLSIMGSFYNCALALYYYKTLCSNMNDEQIAKRYEKWIHIGSVVWSLGTAIAAWQQDLYSYSGLGCWIAPEPLRCHRRDDVDCIRGEDAYIYVWLYMGIPETFVFNYIMYSMWMIYIKVKEVSRRAEKWSFGSVGDSIPMEAMQPSHQLSDRNISDGSLHTRPPSSAVVSYRGSISGNDNRGSSRYAARTRESAWQAFLYINAYFVTHLWAMIVGMIELGGGTVPFYLLLIHQFFWPLQGVINVFIFLRPRINSIQKSSCEMYYFTSAYHSVFLYDEVRQRSSKWTPARPHEESQPKSGTTHSTADSLRKATGEELDAISTPATHAGMNETAGEESNAISTHVSHGMNESRQEELFQPVIHEEASSRHHAP
jgi:hypothetical protein